MPDRTQEGGLEWFLERIDRAEKIILDLIKQPESAKALVILDLGLSKFEHREKFRAFTKSNEYELKIHFLDILKETRLKRVMQRNAQKGTTYEFDVSKENFSFMEEWFETPTPEEMINGVTRKE